MLPCLRSTPHYIGVRVGYTVNSISGRQEIKLWYRGDFLMILHHCTTMAQSLDLPLPEITVNDFQRSWTRFKLVTSAKEWDEAKQKLIRPTLLRSKLVDAYVLLNETACTSLSTIKKALMEGVGISHDPLTTGQAFMSRHQSNGETVRDYSADIKKLFKEAYPEEAQTSPILLQSWSCSIHLLPIVTEG